MSQEKVNKYKEEKANRKETMKKEKRNKILLSVLGIAVAAALVFWIGHSVYRNIQGNATVARTEINLDAIQNYLNTLNPDEENSDEAATDEDSIDDETTDEEPTDDETSDEEATTDEESPYGETAPE
jgi:cytoskeletal protein RodZ